MLLMITLNKIIKQHAEVFDPHKQLKEVMKINSRLYILMCLIAVELLPAAYFLFIDKLLYSFISLIIFLLTTAIGTYWHFKRVEAVYGVEQLDTDRIKRFTQLTLQKVNVNLNIKDENILIEKLVLERLKKVTRVEQTKNAVYLGVITTSMPLFISLLTKNLTNVPFLTFTIMGIGFIILVYSLKSTLKEYTIISKLEHLSEILKEIRLSQLITNREN